MKVRLDSGEEKSAGRIAKLVDAICLGGVENYSYLAKVTGLPEETVRYKITTQLPRLGLALHVVLNYEKLGLNRKIVTLAFPGQHGSKAPMAFNELAKQLYINYFGKSLNSPVYMLTLAVPSNIWTEYKDFIKYLSEKGTLDSFGFEDVLWSRHIPMRTDLYNFHKGEWAFDWSQVDKLKISPETPSPETSPCLDASVEEPDYVDLAILSELQANATLPLSKIASNIRLSEDIVYYHYTEHVKKRGLISQHVIGWTKSGGRYDHNSVSPVIFALRGADKEDTRQVQVAFQKFPFSWLELMTANGTYYVFANIPSSHFNPAMHYVSQNTASLKGKLETSILDPYESAGFALPLEMFDKKKGWAFNKALTIRDVDGLISTGGLTSFVRSSLGILSSHQ